MPIPHTSGSTGIAPETDAEAAESLGSASTAEVDSVEASVSPKVRASACGRMGSCTGSSSFARMKAHKITNQVFDSRCRAARRSSRTSRMSTPAVRLINSRCCISASPYSCSATIFFRSSIFCSVIPCARTKCAKKSSAEPSKSLSISSSVVSF